MCFSHLYIRFNSYAFRLNMLMLADRNKRFSDEISIQHSFYIVQVHGSLKIVRYHFWIKIILQHLFTLFSIKKLRFNFRFVFTFAYMNFVSDFIGGIIRMFFKLQNVQINVKISNWMWNPIKRLLKVWSKFLFASDMILHKLLIRC